MDIPVRALGSGSEQHISVSDEVFDREFNEPLVHQVVTAWLANARTGSKRNRGRADVRGGGHKPWRQKGTGRARAGTRNSPIWRGGGVTFAAQPCNHAQKINRRMYRAALCAMLSELHRQGRLIAVDGLVVLEPRTHRLVELLEALELGRALIVHNEVDTNLYLASRNIPNLSIVDSGYLSPSLLVWAQQVVFTCEALQAIDQRLAA